MATHIDDEEELEKLKTWWKENWIALVGGLAIGFGAIGGWEFYKNWRDGRAEMASQMYEDMKKALTDSRAEDATKIADTLAKDHKGSPYAASAALQLAQKAVEQDKLDEAATRLAWVVENSADEALVGVAKLRRARVLLAQGKHDEALKLLDDSGAAYESLREELRGDIQSAKGDAAAARASYEKALAATTEDAANRDLLQQKMDDLTPASQS
ncbi:MAG: YfgM family protein [Panacagrimonas sp.]